MLFSKKQKMMTAVANGKAIPLSEVPDEAFSSGILGVGFAIEPADGTIYSPVSGKIDSITDSRHAYTILSDDGLDVLVHIGIDTVELGGNGFLSMVSIGDTVKEGDVIARADLDVIRKAEKPTVIPVLVTNPDALGSRDFTYGKVLGGKSEVMRYRLS